MLSMRAFCLVICSISAACGGARGTGPTGPCSYGTACVAACDGGDAEACVVAAQAYRNGEGVAVDKARARAAAGKACAAGGAGGCAILVYEGDKSSAPRALELARTG